MENGQALQIINEYSNYARNYEKKNELILSLISNDGKTKLDNPKFKLLIADNSYHDLLSVTVEGVELLMPCPLLDFDARNAGYVTERRGGFAQYGDHCEYTQEDFDCACTTLFVTPQPVGVVGSGENKTYRHVKYSDGLFRAYVFDGSDCWDTVIDIHRIEEVRDSNFTLTSREIANAIIYIAENYEIQPDGKFNFTVYDTGEIRIGNNIKKIKENLVEIKKAFEEFYSVPRYAKIEIKI